MSEPEAMVYASIAWALCITFCTFIICLTVVTTSSSSKRDDV